MQAVRFVGVGRPAQIEDVAKPSPAETTEFPLDQAVEVYDTLKAGQITGRAVLIPDGA